MTSGPKARVINNAQIAAHLILSASMRDLTDHGLVLTEAQARIEVGEAIIYTILGEELAIRLDSEDNAILEPRQ